MQKLITKREAALYYVRKFGWRVFPLYEVNESGHCACGNTHCSSPGKHPRVKHGVLEATTDETRILMWWLLWPEANIGVATGKNSNIVVLDVDVARGGKASLAEWEAAHGKLPATLECETGGGGRHFYFAHPGWPVKNSVDVAPGLDVRGDGGYVVVPPSTHSSGRVYKWK